MQEFDVILRSFADIREFVTLATVQPFAIMAGNDHQQVSAKSFLGMLSLDFSQPIRVWAEQVGEAFETFRGLAQAFN